MTGQISAWKILAVTAALLAAIVAVALLTIEESGNAPSASEMQTNQR